MVPLVAAINTNALWYLARGSGLVLLGLLTLNLALGIAIQGGWHPPGWPRFVVQGLHRNLALLAVILLVIHVVTIELDPYVPVGWWAVLVPFVSPYRSLWLGLGTLSLDLLVAVVATSLLRGRLRPSWWRVTHWLGYLAWPLAVVHALGTGTDTRWDVVFVYEMACLGLMVAAVLFRLGRAVRTAPGWRTTLILATAAAPVAVLAWAAAGPLQSGWASRAGTPTAALASTRGTGAGAPGSGATSAAPFVAQFVGTIVEAGGGSVATVTISGTVLRGSLQVVLSGQPSSAGGLANASGTASYRPAGGTVTYQGPIVNLQGWVVGISLQAPVGSVIPAELVLSPSSTTSRAVGELYFGTAPPTAGPSQGDDG
jgi:DMSO/TMAO reductase YedYZ heme-binding membrane subunit